MERITASRLNCAINNGKMADILTGKNSMKFKLNNGDMDNLEPQDFIGVLKELYRVYINGNKRVKEHFEKAMLRISKGDLVDVYCAMKLVVIQISYEQQGKAAFLMDSKDEVISSIRRGFENHRERLSEKVFEGVFYESGLLGVVQNRSEWLKEHGYCGIIG